MKMFLLIIALFPIQMSAQVVMEKRYYKKNGAETKDSTKARLMHMASENEDGVLYFEERDMKTNEVLYSYSTKGNEPVGKWVDPNGSIMDYDFDLVYLNKKYSEGDSTNAIRENLNKDKDPSFKVATYIEDGKGIDRLLSENIRYSSMARNKNIKGKVVAQFIVSELGEVRDISIYKSVHPSLDKEVVRVLRKMNKWIPATINGLPISVSFVLPVSFSLAY